MRKAEAMEKREPEAAGSGRREVVLVVFSGLSSLPTRASVSSEEGDDGAKGRRQQ